MSGSSGSKPPRRNPAPAGTPKTNLSPKNQPPVVTAGRLNFDIPSDLAAGNAVQQEIMARVEKAGYNEHSVFAIRLALEEAITNAIKHGNKLDPTKRVRVKASVTTVRTEITVEDQGPGFDRKGVPDPTRDENLHKLSGRGILLMESYMNMVQWTRGGRRVKMLKVNGREAG